jgi:uncharacterized surface protein with fasciclin (FAS1) repeats
MLKIQRRTLLLGSALGAATTLLAACGGGDRPVTLDNIVEIASANPDFSTLVSAVVKAELAGALSGTDQLTVFAPTNAAFDAAAQAIGLADGPALVAALSPETLASVLTYHVVAGRNLSTGLTAGNLPTLYEFDGAAAPLALSLTGGVTLTDAVLTTATVTRADIEASNGVLHIIDKVLVPPGVLNIVQMAQLNPLFSTLVTAVAATSDLVGVLSGTTNYTVFAPTDTAFAALPDGTVAALLDEPNGQLRSILLYHVLAGSVRAADVVALMKPATVSTALPESSFTVTSELQIVEAFGSSASLVATDVIASNGVIHVIDRVLNPDFNAS